MDNQLMLIFNGIKISWFAVFTASGCFIGMIIACLVRKAQRRPVSDVFITVTAGVPLGLIFGRLNYCLFSGDSFSDWGEYIDCTNGGFGLYGVILGTAIAVMITNKLFGNEEPGLLFDAVATGGALAIAVGRFATEFTTAEIGYEVDFRLFSVYDSEQGIYNFAVYKLDCVYESAIFAVCLFLLFIFARNGGLSANSGKTALVMLALHGTDQVITDSMRADALKLGLNEFIKVAQIIGILSCVAVLVYFMVISAKKDSFGKLHKVSIPVILLSIVFGIISEYRVGSANYISKHILMLVCMLALDTLTVIFALRTTERPAKAPAASSSVKETAVSSPVKRSRKASRLYSGIDLDALQTELDTIDRK